jgi:hypothetical protein
MKSTNYGAPHCAVSSNLLLLPSSYVVFRSLMNLIDQVLHSRTTIDVRVWGVYVVLGGQENKRSLSEWLKAFLKSNLHN